MIIFTPNTVISSTNVNANFADSIDVTKHTNPYKAGARLSGDQTINDNTVTLIAFDTEDYDPNGDFDNTAGNYKYVVPVTGYYQVNANVQIIDATGKYVTSSLYTYKDATLIGYSSQNPYPAVTTATSFTHSFNQVLYLVADEAISFKAYIDTLDSGTAVVAGGVGYSRCSFHLLSV